MADDLPELKEGDPYPGAGYFNALRRLVHRALRINVEDGSGLTVSQGADGTVIGGALSGGSDLIGITAEEIPARSGTALGHGDVSIRVVAGDWSTTDGGTLDCGNFTGGAIASGKWCAIGYVDGKPVILSAEC